MDDKDAKRVQHMLVMLGTWCSHVQAVTLGYRYVHMQSPTLFDFCTMYCSCDHKKQNQKLLHTLLHPTLLVLLNCYNGCSRSSLPQPLYSDHKLTLQRQIHGQNYTCIGLDHSGLWLYSPFTFHSPLYLWSWFQDWLVFSMFACVCWCLIVCVCPQASRMQADVRYGNIPQG